MSYGTNAPFGLQARNSLSSATYNGQTTTCFIASGFNTSIFTGDPVIYTANGTILPATGGAAGNEGPTLGVFQGCFFRASNGDYVHSPYWPANTATFQNEPAEAFVCTDSNVVFDIQVSTSANATVNTVTLTQAMIGENANFNIGPGAFLPAAPIPNNPTSGSTISGQSGYYLDLSTLSGAGGATLNLKIIGITPNPLNAFGIPFNNALVVINNDVLKGGTGTAGI